MIYKSKRYVRLFRIQGLKLLINDIWMSYYKRFSTLCVVNDGYYTSYMPKESFDICLDEGLIVYGENFEDYSKDFESFKKSLDLYLKANVLSQDYLSGMFYMLIEFFGYYSKTEFFYTDKAYKLLDMGKLTCIKNSSRDFANKIFFGKDSHLNYILSRLSQRFVVGMDILHNYKVSEILDLFDGKKVSKETIDERNIAILMDGDGKDIKYSYGKYAKDIIEEFERDNLDFAMVKGISANKGIVKGRARVIVSGYNNYDELNQLMNEMDHSEILVSETTSPELLLACQKASAIVTDQSGLLSHAAIISRELGIPCVVGTQNATRIINDGDLIEVDAYKGIVKKLD